MSRWTDPCRCSVEMSTHRLGQMAERGTGLFDLPFSQFHNHSMVGRATEVIQYLADQFRMGHVRGWSLNGRGPKWKDGTRTVCCAWAW